MNKKASVIVLGIVVLALMAVTLMAAAGLWIGGNWIRGRFAASPAGIGWHGPGMMGAYQNRSLESMPFGSAQGVPCADGYAGSGGLPGAEGTFACGQSYAPADGTRVLSLDDATRAVESYIGRLGYKDLYVTEVMEFEQNFYAIVADDTGIGAMELLIGKTGGAVGPEPGPNMMWNAKYGMHRGGRMGMMGAYATGEMALTPAEAEEIAQRWLDVNLPGRSAGEADPFYGYYTLHFQQDGEIEGMLSVHGRTGEVWFHSWHGGFITMTGEHE